MGDLGDKYQTYLTRSQFRKLLPRLGVVKVKLTPEVCDQIYDDVRNKELKDELYQNQARDFFAGVKKKQWFQEKGKLYVP